MMPLTSWNKTALKNYNIFKISKFSKRKLWYEKKKKMFDPFCKTGIDTVEMIIVTRVWGEWLPINIVVLLV